MPCVDAVLAYSAGSVALSHSTFLTRLFCACAGLQLLLLLPTAIQEDNQEPAPSLESAGQLSSDIVASNAERNEKRQEDRCTFATHRHHHQQQQHLENQREAPPLVLGRGPKVHRSGDVRRSIRVLSPRVL